MFSCLSLKATQSTSSSGESPIGSTSTPDSGISMRTPSYDPLLALRSLSLAAKRKEALPPLPPSAPPDEQAPPPPPVKEEGIENISSDEDGVDPLPESCKNLGVATHLTPPTTTVFEFEEISGDESPVMVYNQLEVEEISSDDEHNSDMDISDEDDTHGNTVIELNVTTATSNTTDTFFPAPPMPPPTVPPPIPPAFAPPPGFFSQEYFSDNSRHMEASLYNGTNDEYAPPVNKDNELDYYMMSNSINASKFSPAKQWKVPLAVTRKERRGQNVLYCALEQLSKILLRDVEKKLVESSAFPVLDRFWERKEKEVKYYSCHMEIT